MNCLNGFIGLKGCSTEAPISGVYINDYPTMATELLEKIATPEQASYLGFWDGTQNISYIRFKRDIQAALYAAANAKLDQVLFQTSKSFVQQWQQITPLESAPEYRGVLISIEGSKYMGVRIRQLLIYNSSDSVVEDVPMKIFQAQDATVLWSGEFTLQAGMNYVPVNEVFYTDFDKVNIMLGVDCTNLPTLRGNFVDFGWQSWDVECATRFSFVWNSGFTIFPVTAPLDYGIGNSWRQNTSQSGVYLDAALICSIDSFICSQKDFLIDAWANLLCYNILFAKMGSYRASYFAQGNKEYTERAMQTYLEAYTDSLTIWARQLNLSGEGLCFNCDDAGLVQQGSILP